MPNKHKTHPRKGLLGPQKNFPLATYKRLALMDLRGPFSFSLSSLLSPFPQQSGQPKERRPSGKSSVGLLALIAFRWQYFKKRTSLVPASLVPCIVNLTHIHLGTPERAYSVYARRNRGERERERDARKRISNAATAALVALAMNYSYVQPAQGSSRLFVAGEGTR